MIEYEGSKIVWIAPGSLSYNREHTEWVLPYLYELREGGYPASSKESGYAGGRSRKRVNQAYFETACEVAAELDLRLAKTGQYRDLVEQRYCDELEESSLAKKYNLTEEEVKIRIDIAVSYIASGPCPRWIRCIDCENYINCKRKDNRISWTFADWERYKRREISRKRKYTI